MLVEVAKIPVLAEGSRAEPASAAPRPAEPSAEKVRAERVEPVRRTASEAPARSSRSRLAYDEELARVFVEIVDRESGEVLARYPPEQLVRHIKNLVDREHLAHGQDRAGLLLDRAV